MKREQFEMNGGRQFSLYFPKISLSVKRGAVKLIFKTA
jgi:hypothetical protein